jgi:hypothetical protein
MTDDELIRLLKAAVPPTSDQRPSRDLWPLVVDRVQAPAGGHWIDLGLAAGVILALLLFPEYVALLAYHL